MKSSKRALKGYSALKKDLDTIFSRFIRARDKGVCFTCGAIKEWKYQQCGHFFTRSRLGTRWDEKNCNCQCYSCNMFKGGNGGEYAYQLKKKYGAKIIDTLRERSLKEIRFKTSDLEKLIKKYSELSKSVLE